MAERDIIETEIVIVGAGPAGLAAAIRLKQRSPQTAVIVVEKAAEIGGHILSGAVMDPSGLSELIPDWRERGAPVGPDVTRDVFHVLTRRHDFRLPGFLLPPLMKTLDGVIVSLGDLVRWLGAEAQALGVDIYPMTAAVDVLRGAGGAVEGIVTGDLGVDRAGKPKSGYAAGIGLRAKYTLIAEGARGSLARRTIGDFGLDAAASPQKYGLGLKEVWEIPAALHEPGRVDHFLGRSTVLDVLGARFANRLLEPIWSAEHIERVEIRFDETLGLEGRAGFYDHAGPLVDMIQSHLLQVMAVVAMEPPAALTATDVRDATAAVLRATHVWDDNAVRFSHRARYTAGTAGEERMPSYVDEPGVDPARETETLAQVRVEVRNARWAGVPFTLRSGKALAAMRAEVDVVLRPVRHLPVGFTGDASGAVIRFGLGPDKLTMEISVNGGEEPFALHRATLEADLGLGTHAAYTEGLAAILDGDAMLAVRGDAAEECWRIVQPVRDAWRRGDVPMEDYPAGSDGPDGWAAC